MPLGSASQQACMYSPRAITSFSVSSSGIALERCKIHIEKVGNTSAASVAMALDEAVREGRIAKGDLVLMVAFGAGLSWASALVRW